MEQQHAPGTILLVEDDLDDQEIIIEVLRKLNAQHQIITLKNGQEALEYLRGPSKKPFLILCDINMPVMNGLEFRAVLEADVMLRNKSIPFVFLTTTGNIAAVNKAYELTVQGFFQKRNTLEEFSRNLKTILEYWSACLHPQ